MGKAPVFSAEDEIIRLPRLCILLCAYCFLQPLVCRKSLSRVGFIGQTILQVLFYELKQTGYLISVFFREPLLKCVLTEKSSEG